MSGDDLDDTTVAGTSGTGTGDEPADDAAPRDELRERLLRAAATAFARRGYAGTRIMDIVREAGLSTGAVYGRFSSKNDLLREAVVSRSTRAGVFAAAGVHHLADLVAGAASRIDRPLSNAEAMRLEAYVTARREPEVSQALAEAAEHWRSELQPVVDAAEADGTLADDVDPEALLFLVRIVYYGLLLHRGSGIDGPDPAAWKALIGRIVWSLGQPAPPDLTAGEAAD
ncbi:MAG: TetR/AcrR family transcriptional regulator [Actinomycetota bacterium]|nr:TetR/AcrR family transcriptional regulator [Actinomycetota bacterium]